MRYPASYYGPQQMGGGFNPFMGGGFNPFMGGISNFGTFAGGSFGQPQLQGPNNMPGNQVPGGGGMPRTMDFRDSNNDGVDDRDQNNMPGGGGSNQPQMNYFQMMQNPFRGGGFGGGGFSPFGGFGGGFSPFGGFGGGFSPFMGGGIGGFGGGRTFGGSTPTTDPYKLSLITR